MPFTSALNLTQEALCTSTVAKTLEIQKDWVQILGPLLTKLCDLRQTALPFGGFVYSFIKRGKYKYLSFGLPRIKQDHVCKIFSPWAYGQ